MLSVVIPALNAAATLPSCLAAVAGVDEVVVVDGGSSDDTVSLARKGGARVVTAKRGRGQQLRAGAAEARGDWLLFVHADTRLGADWHEAVMRHIADTPEAAGYLRLRLDDAAWQARVIERGVAWRARRFGLPYGDQGLLISRRLYAEAGGYQEIALMEDVDLVGRIGRERLRSIDAAALTSAERWRRDGWWRRTVRNLVCLGLFALGVGPARVARFYR